MMKKFFLIASLYYASFQLQAQTFVIDYDLSSLSTTACSVFSGSPTVLGYQHVPTYGGVSFDGVKLHLPYEVVSTFNKKGTGYSIAFQLANHKLYQISIEAATPGGGPIPILQFSASNTLPATSTSCAAPSGGGQVNQAGTRAINSSTSISSSTLTTYVVAQDFSATANYTYLNIGVPAPSFGGAYMGDVVIKKITINQTVPVTPKINNSSSVFFSSSAIGNGGSITGTPGALVNVTATAGGPPGNTFSLAMSISGVNFTDGTQTISVTNTSQTKQVKMPASGSITWTGSYTYSSTTGSGSVSVATF